MKIIVFGGDGFCGWPVSLNLSKDHEVMIFDSLTRRDGDTFSPSLTKIHSPADRCAAAGIQFVQGWADQPHHVFEIVEEFRPDVVIHFAEQRSAPWSMLSSANRILTVERNLMSTQSILEAIAKFKPDTHIIHLGTMGVYGYSTTDDPIPEGYVNATIGGESETQNGKTVTLGGTRQSIVYPASPGSVYHMTKVLDHTMFQFYAKNWNLKITDLHQGIVWGTETEDTKSNPVFTNRFDYDGEYGTVLNRFLMQAVSNIPLTVYGTGGQTRAFIHIQDTVRCVRAAVESGTSPDTDFSQPRVFNQVTECLNVKKLAELIQRHTGCQIDYLPNPRKEKAENDLNVSSTLAKVGGFEPITLDSNLGLMAEVQDIVVANSDRIQPELVYSKANWHKA